MDNIEVAEIMEKLQEEIAQLCESYISAPNTKLEQEKTKQVIQDYLSEYPMQPIERIFVEVDLKS